MISVSVNQFRDQLPHYADLATKDHEVVEVTRRNGENLIVMGRDDWLSIQETLYVMQNRSLMQQIQKSLKTHATGKGRQLSQEGLDESGHL